ncbi:hypothetical protein B0J13DRAFT_585331 [Dactylonectria estremocensis]|uniref:Uncharacterized protein n=1 Tax=Dactylonectria estremocensis TaxID=1079267 RepID=A0A9P9J3U7_9HYPO|nr:hypothetical protein B0J13DRAFT_585331 [Dactylonectria estremocensis]
MPGCDDDELRRLIATIDHLFFNRYLVYCKQFLYYYLNVLHLDKLTLLKEHSFRFIGKQRIGLKRVWSYLHFVGVLGIDGESRQLQPAHLFIYMLAGLIYIGRALLAEWAIPTREQPGIVGLAEYFA